MDEMNKDPQQLTPEEQLDLLLEKFLEDPNDEIPTFTEPAPEEGVELSENAADVDEAIHEAQSEPVDSLSPEAQLDMLLASFQDSPSETAPVETETEEEEIAEDDAAEEIQGEDQAPIVMPILDMNEDEPTPEEAGEEKSEEDEDADKVQEEDQAPIVMPILDMNEDEATPEDAGEEKSEEDEDADKVQEEDQAPIVMPILDMNEDEATPEEKADEEGPEEDEDADKVQEEGQVPIVVPIPDMSENEDAPAESDNTEEEPATEPAPEDSPADHAVGPDEQCAEEAAPAQPEDSENEKIQEGSMPQTSEEPATETPAEETSEAVAPTEEAAPATLPEEEKSMQGEGSEPQAEEEEEQPEEKPAPPKKRRPRNNKTYGFFGIPHLLTTLIWLGIIVFIGVGLGKFVWNCAADVLALGRPDTEVVITITDDDDLDSLAQKLKTTGLIKYPSLFKIYGQISECMDSIRTGTFKLNTLFDYHALVDAMSSNQRRETTNVTIPEGYTCAQMFRLLESRGVSTVEKLEAAAASADLGNYWFLEGVERGTANCLEGFLFPDTYTFYLDHDPVGVLQKFLNNFNKRFNDAMKIKLDTLNATLSEKMRQNGLSEEYIAEHQMTVRDVVIIASMIERETASNPESYNISSVIYNRLTNPAEYPFLNIDAALVYVLGHGNLTLEDLKYDSPYNTYLYPGLIPGAISNPGSYSLDAALSPTDTEYHYYALNPATGSHHFSKTLKEHNDFLESIRKEEPEEETEE